MDALHVFQTDLAGLLTREAASRARPETSPCGADIKSAALLQRLAADTERLDAAVVRRWADALRDHQGHGPLSASAIALLRSVGVHVCPTSANDLVAWMGSQLASAAMPPTATVATSPTSARPRPAWLLPVRLSAGAAIVLPLLALCHLLTGGRMIHDRALAAAGTTRVATVATAEPIIDGRSAGAYARIVLDFPSDGEADLCRATVTSWRPGPLPRPGDTLAVVPRGGCGTPLVIATLGDPRPQFVMAGTLLVLGLIALQAWRVLGRRPTALASQRERGPAGATRSAIVR